LQQAFGQAVRQRVLVIEVPVRIVGREQQHFVRADLVDDAQQLLGFRRRVERLDGQPYMLTRIGDR
jgi:hypothetical protein